MSAPGDLVILRIKSARKGDKPLTVSGSFVSEDQHAITLRVTDGPHWGKSDDEMYIERDVTIDRRRVIRRHR